MAKTKTPTTSSSAASTDRATEYAKKVAAGKILAGPDIRNACARHLRDLKNGAKRGLSWDAEKAGRAIRYFEKVLKLNGGEFEGKPFMLLAWQAFIVGSIFGWMGANGFRRFREVYVESGKGSGKSPLAAGVGMYCLTADNEPRAEVYAAATKKDQAMILFRDAVAMRELSPDLRTRLKPSGIGDKVWNLSYEAAGAFFRPISADDGQSGPRPHCSLIDEVHEHKNGNVIKMMRAGTKGRRQALMFMITNSGHDRTSVCYDYHDYGRKVCAGLAEDDAFFAFICSLDEGDDPFKDESCWGKANPSLGETFKPQYLRELVVKARGMPSQESVVRRLNFCQWVESDTPWIGADAWLACEKDFAVEAMRGEDCYGGLDLSGTRDLTALALYFPRMKRAAVEFWTPGDTLEERAKRDRVNYGLWRDHGHLHAPRGRAVDYTVVAERLGELAALFNIKAIAFDPYRIKYLEPELERLGIDVKLVSHGQGFAKSSESGLWMPHSIETLEGDLGDKDIQIKPNPCLRWNAASAVLEADNKDNRIFAKKKATGRIDGVVALAMARGAAEDLADDGDLDGFFSNPIMVGT